MYKTKRLSMSRISIEVSPDQHKAIKALALLEGVPIKTLLWEPLEKKLHKHLEQAKKTKGYGAGHPGCPLCQIHAKSGRYNAKTEKAMNDARRGVNVKRFKSLEELFVDLKS